MCAFGFKAGDSNIFCALQIMRLYLGEYKMRKIFLLLVSFFCFQSVSYAAPCYGTKMPEKNRFFGGLQTYNIFKRNLEDNLGKVKSMQHFILLSYGVYQWLSIDLKGGVGNIKQAPLDADSADYPYAFAGGYGLRLKFYDRDKLDAVLGFQHISVHPKSIHINNLKNRGILDDWQVSLLASYDCGKWAPYIGTKWSRVDYIHWVGEDRKRRMSDFTRSFGLITGFDLPVNEKLWFNLEGQFFDGTALSASLNYSF